MSNRRRVAETIVAALAWLALAAVVTLGLTRVPIAFALFGYDAPSWWPNPTWLWAIYASGAMLGLCHAGVRVWQRRIDAPKLARRLDRNHRTHDVLATALAIERGELNATADLAAIVEERARTCASTLGCPVPSFVAPSRALATVGLVAATVALLPSSADSLVDLAVGTANAATAEHGFAVDDPLLAPERLERFERLARGLAELEERETLRDSARSRLRAARDQLATLDRHPSRSLGKLSKAEQMLRELQQQSASEGIHDPERLRAMADEELVDALSSAMQHGHDDAAAALADELAERLRDADDDALASLSRAVERESEATATAGTHDFGDGLPEQLRAGDREAAREALRKLAREMERSNGAASAERLMDQALEEIRRARAEQLAQLNGNSNGERKVQEDSGDHRGPARSNEASADAGQSDGAGSERDAKDVGAPDAAGVPLGLPGGRPGPGGGHGSDGRDGAEALPGLSRNERVDAALDGSAGGSVTVIQRFTRGYRDDGQYEDLHQEYESVAESAVRHERIPLTRREYIRNYFQAVRPR